MSTSPYEQREESTAPERQRSVRSLKPGHAATIREVAKRAGVSVTTVSHALSGKRTVAEQTRVRVLEVIAELEYRPNVAASSLRTGLSNAMALIVPDIANPFFAELARGVEDEAQKRGWSVFLCNTSLQPEREADYVARCLAGGVDGVIYCATYVESSHVARLRDEVSRRLPVVVCDERIDGMIGGVFSDNYGGGRLAAKHLLAAGRQHLVVIGGPSDLPTARERVAGFCAAAADEGVIIPDECITWTDYRMDAGAAAMADLLHAHHDLDGVFAADDLLAIGAMRQLASAGRTVPDDVAVCGFDDVNLASLVSPSLTSVRQRIHDLGAEAATMMLSHVLDGEPLSETVLPVELVIRESTGTSVGWTCDSGGEVDIH